MGRPKKEVSKTKGLRVRMTEEDLSWIKASAERCGVSASELLRAAVYDFIFHLDPEDVSVIAQRVYERSKTA